MTSVPHVAILREVDDFSRAQSRKEKETELFADMSYTSSSIKNIIKRNGSAVAYDRSRITNAILKATISVGKSDKALSVKMSEQVEQALIATYGAEHMPTVEDIQDVVESVLMRNGHVEIARNYIIYRHERAMERAARAVTFEVTDYVPYRKIYEVLRWNINHGCDTVDGLNKIIAAKKLPDLIEATEARYQREIEIAAEMIIERASKVRIAIVAGPSSSGKTTTTIKISEKLAQAGLGFKAINIDHYFFDLEMHPKDEFGDYDYETPRALDMDLINQHLVTLLDGGTVKTPNYDFKTGKRTLNVHDLILKKGEILLIDSLHGLFEGMTKRVPSENKFSIYIETLGQFRTFDGTYMRWADNRLLRRMSRDKDHRNLQPIQTLTHWHYVRKSELKYIIPYIKRTDYIVNSALPFELPFLKAKLFRYISRSKAQFASDPKRLDAHIRVNRVYDLLKPLKSVADDTLVSKTSLLREFIGGSLYEY